MCSSDGKSDRKGVAVPEHVVPFESAESKQSLCVFSRTRRITKVITVQSSVTLVITGPVIGRILYTWKVRKRSSCVSTVSLTLESLRMDLD
jgi:Ni,Fe-hydrogenase I cytochrome b subunit